MLANKKDKKKGGKLLFEKVISYICMLHLYVSLHSWSSSLTKSKIGDITNKEKNVLFTLNNQLKKPNLLPQRSNQRLCLKNISDSKDE